MTNTDVSSHKAINANLILGDSAWLKTGDVYQKAHLALMKLSLSDLQTIRTVVCTTPEAVNNLIHGNN